MWNLAPARGLSGSQLSHQQSAESLHVQQQARRGLDVQTRARSPGTLWAAEETSMQSASYSTLLGISRVQRSPLWLWKRPEISQTCAWLSWAHSPGCPTLLTGWAPLGSRGRHPHGLRCGPGVAPHSGPIAAKGWLGNIGQGQEKRQI